MYMHVTCSPTAEALVLFCRRRAACVFLCIWYTYAPDLYPPPLPRTRTRQIEAVGHNYLGTFFASADALLAPGGVMVMQAITTPEHRYEEYIRSTDFINTIIFPGNSIKFCW